MQRRFPFLRRVLHAFATTIVVTLLFAGGIAAASAAATPEPNGADILATFDGLQSTIARQYEVSAEPSATPAPDGRAITLAYILVLRFDTAANAEQIWDLTDRIPGIDDATELTVTPLAGFGDKATLDRSVDGPTGESASEGILIIRDGATGIIVSGRGSSTSAALSERLQALATFVLSHPASPDAVTVTYGGDGTGGDFARLPGETDTDVLQGLVPRRDYDLKAEITPIDPTATPVAPCSCLPPATATA